MKRIGRALLAAMILQGAWILAACQAAGEPSLNSTDTVTPGAVDATSPRETIDLWDAGAGYGVGAGSGVDGVDGSIFG